MKRLLVLGLFISIGTSVFSQAKPDTTIVTYIKTRNLVKITDTAALPKVMMPYYYKLMDYVKTNLPYQLKDTYVLTAYIHNTATELSIPLNDINGVLLYKKAGENIPKPKDTVINGKKIRISTPLFNGDPSGRQVNVVIDKATGKMKFYRSN